MKRSGILFVLIVVAGTAACGREKSDSIEKLNVCVAHFSKKEYATAINECEKAISLWKENHSAYWHIGGAHAAQKHWKEAVTAFESAARIKDSEPMYHQMLGITLYYRAIDDAEEALAAAKGKKNKAEVAGEVNRATLNFEPAIQHLQRAVKLKPELWNAHYHLGRIYRDTERSAEAAASLTEAIKRNPYEPNPYIALSELYRQWDYPDQAIQVATIGAQLIPGQNERAGVWYQVGMGYHEKRQDDQAITAFTKALEDKRDLHLAKFQRGQAYYRKQDYQKAKKDLEEYSKAGSSSEALPKQQANKMLMDIAAKQI